MLYPVRYVLFGFVTGSSFGFCFLIHVNCTWIAFTFHVNNIYHIFPSSLNFWLC